MGANGCETCPLMMLSEDGAEIDSCLNVSKGCPSGYVSLNQWAFLEDDVQQLLPGENGFAAVSVRLCLSFAGM